MTGYLIDKGEDEGVLLIPLTYIHVMLNYDFKLQFNNYVKTNTLQLLKEVFILNNMNYIYITDDEMYSKIKNLVKNDNKLAKIMWDTFKNYENEQERNNKTTEITRIISGL